MGSTPMFVFEMFVNVSFAQSPQPISDGSLYETTPYAMILFLNDRLFVDIMTRTGVVSIIFVIY